MCAVRERRESVSKHRAETLFNKAELYTIFHGGIIGLLRRGILGLLKL